MVPSRSGRRGALTGRDTSSGGTPMRAENQAERIRKTFAARFGREPLLVRSPGRVNLIGEHTDYNEGYVLPAAVDRAVVFAVAPREGRTARLLAADLGEECAVALDRLSKPRGAWPDYLVGVLEQLRRVRPRLGGFDCAFGGDIPVGAGMSSS
ncbi:MAG TPA: galactokinase family protein, partial [Kiritimatiellia bacterium]|nr:galactokinase family protein [Kiritimatiellia bacterium]